MLKSATPSGTISNNSLVGKSLSIYLPLDLFSTLSSGPEDEVLLKHGENPIIHSSVCSPITSRALEGAGRSSEDPQKRLGGVKRKLE